MRGRSVGMVAAAGVMAFGLTGVADAREPAAHGAQAARSAASELFVQSADGGTLRRLKGHRSTYLLTLSDLASRVTVFTDRPARKAGTETPAQFVARWRSRGFATSPPNAALALSHASLNSDVKVFEISRPRLNRRTGALSFIARDLGGKSTTALSGFATRADRILPARFREASLFIDSASPAFLKPLYLELSVHDADRTRVTVTFDDPAQIVLDGSNDTFFSPFDYGVVRLRPTSVNMQDGVFRFFVQPQGSPLTGKAVVDGSGQVSIGAPGRQTVLKSGRFSIKSPGIVTQ